METAQDGFTGTLAGQSQLASLTDDRCVSTSQENAQSSSRNRGETVYGDWRGIYMYQTRHYPHHNPGDHDILLGLYAASCDVCVSLYDN